MSVSALPPARRPRPAMRWLVPAAAALVVLGGGAAVGALTAAADPNPPTRSAAQLLADLQTARLDGLSGTVVARSELGLPDLTAAGAGTADLTALLSGTHTLRVWYSGPDKARVALVSTLGETDMITNGSDVWVWSSRDKTATHRTITPGGTKTAATAAPSLPAFSPQQLADLALRALGTSTQVSTEGKINVAGRDAYELVLAPRDVASLIGSVRLAVDATEHVPLRVRVFARGAKTPAIEVGFTQISFARPTDDQFAFNPPPGTKVVEQGALTKPDAVKPSARPSAPLHGGAPGGHDRPKIATVGSGWATVIVAAVPDATTTTAKPSDDAAATLRKFIAQLPTVSGSWGSGHLFTSNLVNVLITDDGRILIGAVRPEKLYLAAADPAAKLGK